MIPNRIDREVLIEAPAAVVWETITQPEQIRQWWSDEAEFEPAAGSDGTLVWRDRATSAAYTARIRVEEVDPPNRFSFRWVHPEGAEPDLRNSLLVEFTLTSEGDQTKLRVVESGLAEVAWPEDEKAAYAESHSSGWDRHLADLQTFVRQRAHV